ncbi:MAG: hypothetical protein KC635_18255 [Myxococcales bacterium]|nr:hypothetical protein [Myxococcales bacterium]MCB9733558.1 hypothetical protein [Deltaproteobacteria bacterium]
MRALLACPLALAVAAAVLGGCGDSVTFVDCPLGTTPQGAECVPIAEGDTGIATDTAQEADVRDTIGSETTDTVTNDTVIADAAAPDADVAADTNGDTAAPGPVGAACEKNADCAGGTCLDWTGGYCTALGCTAGSCPSGSGCRPFAGNAVCLADCASDGDCRAGAQACKGLLVDGAVAKSCVGVDAGAASIGSACGDATDCAGGAACLSAFPGGYCAILGCTAGSCPGGSACVRVDGVPSCLRTCAGDGDCGGAPGAERRCGVLDGFGGVGPVDVCISGAAEKPLGASCRTDFECEDGTCEVLGEGRCSQTGAPCNPETVAADCNGAEFCHVTAESRVGVCARPCVVGGLPCAGESFCLAETGDPNRGVCRPACATAGAVCNAEADLVCHFGIPIDGGGQGRYVCGRVRARDLGAACTQGAQCRSGACLSASGGAGGYCTVACGDDDYCPYLGSCVVSGADRDCLEVCFAPTDCPAGFGCQLATGASRSVCVPAN